MKERVENVLDLLKLQQHLTKAITNLQNFKPLLLWTYFAFRQGFW